MSDGLLVDEFLSSKNEYVEKKTEEYIKAVIAIELEKKALTNDLKEIKNQYKEDGVDIKTITKVFSRLKNRLKAKQEELEELDRAEELYGNNQEIINELYNLVRKD